MGSLLRADDAVCVCWIFCLDDHGRVDLRRNCGQRGARLDGLKFEPRTNLGYSAAGDIHAGVLGCRFLYRDWIL